MQSPKMIRLSREFKHWLFDQALPLWVELGIDRQRGGFYEAIGFDRTSIEAPRRLRVVARQIYVFAVAGSLNWSGPWREAVCHGLSDLCTRYRRGDGLFRRLVQSDGSVADETPTLYEQAFVLLALAKCYPEFEDEFGVSSLARGIMVELEVSRRFHAGGFLELSPHPLQSNPHMHLLEAVIAWMERDDAPCWSDVAGKIVALCLETFIDSRNGFVHEYFEGDWQQASGVDGRIIEPGHQFEWSWLLKKWGALRYDESAGAVAASLFHRGNHGILPALGIVGGTALDTGTTVEDGARLWPQTERLRTVWAFARSSESNGALGLDFSSEIQRAAAVVWRYLDTPVKGLWHERMTSSGSFPGDMSAASSLYHVTGMIAELISGG